MSSRMAERDTAGRILRAALAAFAQRGVEATSLDSLALELGIRKQTILYWFPSKDALVLAVVDHAVGELGQRLGDAVRGARPGVNEAIDAVVDATFRLGTTDPELLALVREVTRLGPSSSTYLTNALEPLVARAADALGAAGIDKVRARRALIDGGARVIGMATEAEVRAELGQPPDLAWLRARRRSLRAGIRAELT